MAATPKPASCSDDGMAAHDAAPTNRAELEAGDPPEKTVSVADPHLVDWDGPGDAANPQNWPAGKKWLHIIVVSLFALVTCVLPPLSVTRARLLQSVLIAITL